MARIAGITTTKDAKGKLASITINLKKHPQAVPVLQGVGLLEKSSLRQEVEANPENFMTVDEAREKSLENVRAIWKKKYQ